MPSTVPSETKGHHAEPLDRHGLPCEELEVKLSLGLAVGERRPPLPKGLVGCISSQQTADRYMHICMHVCMHVLGEPTMELRDWHARACMLVCM